MYELAAGIASVGTGRMLGYLGLALLLSTAIGFEREVRAKSAGMRTHTLVGVGSALFILVSKYGFSDVLGSGAVVLDPSRVSAQIVSGIGFIGGGLIFVRRDMVRGLTTAASVWLVAGVGMASGAGLVILAIAATAAHLFIVLGYAPLESLLYRVRGGPRLIRIAYRDGRGVLRSAIQACTSSGFTVAHLRVEREDSDEDGEDVAVVSLRVQGKRPLTPLLEEISLLPGVVHASTGEADLAE
ncbi:MAG TPA: MgtC/SapB family protein [Mycobacteriales bacterium]|nr:MgtC/SapB family protein [Mycobacteriales bacterium]